MKKYTKFLLLLFILLLISCKSTEYVEIEKPVVHTEIEYRDITHYDSIYIFETKEIIKDTIYKNKIEYKYKYINKLDTIYKVDTLTNVVQNIEYKEVIKIPFIYKLFAAIGVAGIGVLFFKYVLLK